MPIFFTKLINKSVPTAQQHDDILYEPQLSRSSVAFISPLEAVIKESFVYVLSYSHVNYD